MQRYLAPALVCALLLPGCDNRDSQPVVGILERDRVALAVETSEPLAAVYVAEGDRVEAGEVLLRLDDSRLAAELAVRRAREAEARAALQELIAGPRREEILEARSRLKGARQAVETARQTYERQLRLSRAGFASVSALDQALARREAAIAERDALEARLQRLLTGARAETLEQARARLQAAEAAAQALAIRVERLTVKAPHAAIVDALPFQIGERPPNGAVVAVLLAGPSYARIYIPQALRGKVQPGMEAWVSVPSLDSQFTGRVRFIASEAAFTPFFALTERDRGRLSYLAEVALEGEAASLPAGMPVSVRFAAVGGG